jgi:predicted RNA binding protein YcfA (HicA-like mRNA interferase family)
VKPVSGERLCRALRAKGWTFKRISGSHHIYSHPGPPARAVSVPVHGHHDLKTGTQQKLMRQAGLTDADL